MFKTTCTGNGDTDGERESKLVFYAQSTSAVTSGKERVSKLVFYAQSTSAVISGREREREDRKKKE